ncbi:unnamed protein product [Mucor hiemalis]
MMKLYSFLLFIFISTATIVMGQKLLYEPDAPDYKPSSPSCASQSLFDKLAPDPSLSTFMDVLTQVEDIFALLNSTEEDTSFTVFCPVNSAFRNELNVYTREHLEEFLRNHIVPTNKIDPDTLKRLRSPLKTLLPGQTIEVTHHFLSHKTMLNNHAMVDTLHPVEAASGIAYKIDHLLRPTQ